MTDDEIAQLPVMINWKRATFAALEELGPEWVISFIRNLADKLEAEMMPDDER